MGRAPCCDKMGVKKGPWSQEEDRKLIDHVHKCGFENWRALPRQAGLLRCGKSCRLRWTNYLRPDLKRGNLSPEEEQTIFRLHGVLGNRWSTIASYLPGRTDNEIKNIWNTHLKKRLAETGSGVNRPVPIHSSSSTAPTIPMAVNNCSSKSLAMDNSHCFGPGSPNSEGSFSSSKDSAPQFTEDLNIGLQGSAESDQHLLETCSAHRHETDEQRSAHDYINSLKIFLEIAEESSSQDHGSENSDIARLSDHVSEDYDVGTSDYINNGVFCSRSMLSGNQLEHEILETSLADHSQENCSSSHGLHVYAPVSLSPEFLLDFPDNPMDVADVLMPTLWMD